jgi:polysaccharide deacetylase family protein (PEP-CTERM system associated)
MASGKGHIITVLLHDYFHRGVFKQCIGEKQWNRFESRLDKNVDDTLELLSTHNVTATFFTLGWIADKNPEIISRIVKEGHEISNAGYWARSIVDITPAQLEEDLVRSRKALEDAGANRIIGFRSAYKWISKRDLGALHILSKHGYRYDASYRPAWIKYNDNVKRRIIFTHPCDSDEIIEFPVSTASLLGFNIPISGGSYMRHFPHRAVFAEFKKWIRTYDAPFVLYFHPWELDAEQPVISAVDKLDHLRQYRNLGKLKQILPLYLQEAPFTSISQYLGLPLEYPLQVMNMDNPSSQHQTLSLCTTLNENNIACEVIRDQNQTPANSLLPVTIAIPCYNEASSIPYLDRALAELVAEGGVSYDFHFVFVDDCSQDNTVTMLHELYNDNEKCSIVRHESNRGVAAALRTGILSAPTEIVCTIDADCSYDPLELLKMIPMLEDGVDMVTASPYHEDGFVLGVPPWRLFLSKSLSDIYHHLLHHKLSTYTSCFRVCRQSSITKIGQSYDDFRGVIEQLSRLDLDGGCIVEYPTTLHSRIFGQSKMKVIKTIFGHLGLIYKISKIKIINRLFSKRKELQ